MIYEIPHKYILEMDTTTINVFTSELYILELYSYTKKKDNYCNNTIIINIYQAH